MKRIIVLFGLILNIVYAQTESCHKVKAAFDIGSGTTKMKVALVNECTKIIEKILFESKQKVSFKEDLAKSQNGQFSTDVLDQGKKVLSEMVQIARQKYKAQVFRGVATSAFRDSKNSQVLINHAQKFGLQIEIIDQELEAKLGFAAVLSTGKYDPQNIVVWDIGGGSMQMTSFQGKNSYQFYLGQMAAVPFKNYVLQRLQKRNLKVFDSPNPMGWKVSQRAFRKARRVAQREIPRMIKSKISKHKATVVGIGGVHVHSLMGQMGLKEQGSYTYQQLFRWRVRNSYRSDREIGGDYASTDATNLVLILGFMRALKLGEVQVEDVNLSDGVLVYTAQD